jgi:23S rRNA pseudouridine2604 synthase
MRRGRFGKSPTKTQAPSGPSMRTRGPSPIPKKDPNSFPMRINKYLAFKGFATRRDADALINRKIVFINDRLANLGDRVNETDVVEVKKRKPEPYIYFAYNKPLGPETESVREGDKGVFPILDLDNNSEGLVLFSNDRRLIDRLVNNRHEHTKEYLIQTFAPVRANFKEKMQEGIVLPGHGSKKSSTGAGLTPPSAIPIACEVKLLEDNIFRLRTTDNGNHIRQICSFFGAEVKSLARTRILNIDLGKLAHNAFRPIKDEELKEFLTALKLV